MCDQRIEANDPILSHDELIEKLKRWEHFMDDFMTVQVYTEDTNEVIVSVDITDEGTKGIVKDGFKMSIDGIDVD